MPQGATYQAPSVARALKILELLADSQEGLGISELARELDLSKATVFGLCRQLEAGGALAREPLHKRYTLGPWLFALAGRSLAPARLRELAAPELNALANQLGETVSLGALLRGEVRVLLCAQPAGVIRLAAGPGTKLPLTAGAVGKVFLAGLTPARVEQALAQGLPAYTARTVTDMEEFRRQLEQTRQDGYALEQDEYLEGVWGVAVPLAGGMEMPAALWAIGFSSTLRAGQLQATAQALLGAAQRLRKAYANLA